MENIKWAWRVLRSKAFVVCTEDNAVCSIPMIDPTKFTHVIMLSAQYSSLIEFRDKLNEVIKEHEVISKELFGEKPKNYKEVK